jgi:hypothetical protein
MKFFTKDNVRHFLKRGDVFRLTCERCAETEQMTYLSGRRISIPAGTILVAVDEHYTYHRIKNDGTVDGINPWLRWGKVVTFCGIHWIVYNTNSVELIE